jgi:hypothetical protein
MAANIASILIIGVVRFGIERSWDVETFGKVSLTLSISNLLMLFMNAIGIIMFPVLKRANEDKLPSIYETMRTVLMVFLFGALITYYPLRVALSAWLPKYADSLTYMSILFPICLYEGKMTLLINTYLKTLRREKLMFSISALTVLLSVMSTLLTTVILKNLNLAIVSIVVFSAFRCTFAEISLAKILDIKIYKDIALELSVALIFVLSGWFINSWLSLVIYAFAYALYLFMKKKDIVVSFRSIMSLAKA